MTSIEQRLAALEARTRAAEDELAIIRLVASYGPLVDTGRDDLAPALFTADGVYDVSHGRLAGPEAFAQLLRHQEHHDTLRQGIAHIMGLPWVRVEGDHAVATNCTTLFLREGDGYRTFRVAQNVWKLVRTPDGWKISERTNRLIGSDGEAPALLASAV
ncbi:MAG TPA: nuclear transport factor 2 family protein [Novosphingobium sp.]